MTKTLKSELVEYLISILNNKVACVKIGGFLLQKSIEAEVLIKTTSWGLFEFYTTLDMYNTDEEGSIISNFKKTLHDTVDKLDGDYEEKRNFWNQVTKSFTKIEFPIANVYLSEKNLFSCSFKGQEIDITTIDTNKIKTTITIRLK